MMPNAYMRKRRSGKRRPSRRNVIKRKYKHPNADLDKEPIKGDRNKPITGEGFWYDRMPPVGVKPPTDIVPDDGAGRDTVEIDLPEGVGAGASPKQRALFTRIRDFISENLNRSGRVTNDMVSEMKSIKKNFTEIHNKGLINKQLKEAGQAMEAIVYKATGSVDIPKAGEPWNPQKPSKPKPLPTIPRKDKNKKVTKKGIWSVVTITHYPGTRNQRVERRILRRGKDITNFMLVKPGHVISTPVGTYRYIGKKRFGYSGWKPEKGPVVDSDFLPTEREDFRVDIVRNTIIPYLRNMNISDETSYAVMKAFLKRDDEAVMRAIQRSNMTADEIESFLEKISFEPEEGSDGRLVKPRKTEPKIAQSHKWYGFPTEAYDKKKKAIRVTTVGEY